MSPRCLIIPLLALVAPALSGCNAWHDRAEFAPPMSRWRATEPSPVTADAPPPMAREVYCYRSLAQTDCFASKQEDRHTGYTGTYPDRN